MKKILYILSGMIFCSFNLQGMHNDFEQKTQKTSLVPVNNTNGPSTYSFSQKFFSYFSFGKQKSKEPLEENNEKILKTSSDIKTPENHWKSEPESSKENIINDSDSLVDTMTIWKNVENHNDADSSGKDTDKETRIESDLLNLLKQSQKDSNQCIESLKQIENETENQGLKSIIKGCIDLCNKDSIATQKIQDQLAKTDISDKSDEYSQNYLYSVYKKTIEDKKSSDKLIEAISSFKDLLPAQTWEQIRTAKTFEQKTAAMFAAFAIASHQKDLFLKQAFIGFHKEISNQRMEIDEMKEEMDRKTSQIDEMQKKFDEMEETIKKLSNNKDDLPKKSESLSTSSSSKPNTPKPKKIMIYSKKCPVGNFIYKGSFDPNTLSANGQGAFEKGASLSIFGRFNNNFLDITHPIIFKKMEKTFEFKSTTKVFTALDMLNLSSLSEIAIIDNKGANIIAFTNKEKTYGYIFNSKYIFYGQLDNQANPAGYGSKIIESGIMISGKFQGINTVFSD